MPKQTTTDDELVTYGFVAGDDGWLTREKRGRPYERFQAIAAGAPYDAPTVDGTREESAPHDGYLYDRWDADVQGWVRQRHSIARAGVDPGTGQAVLRVCWVWPADYVDRIYRTANTSR